MRKTKWCTGQMTTFQVVLSAWRHSLNTKLIRKTLHSLSVVWIWNVPHRLTSLNTWSLSLVLSEEVIEPVGSGTFWRNYSPEAGLEPCLTSVSVSVSVVCLSVSLWMQMKRNQQVSCPRTKLSLPVDMPSLPGDGLYPPGVVRKKKNKPFLLYAAFCHSIFITSTENKFTH